MTVTCRAVRARRFTRRVLTLNEQLAQRVNVASQDAEDRIAFKSPQAPITTTLQAIAGLECANGRLHPGVTLGAARKRTLAFSSCAAA